MDKKKKAPVEERRNYHYKKKRHPIWRTVQFFVGFVLRKPKQIINLNDEPIDEHAIIVGPHHGKWGPVYLNRHFPIATSMMGHHAMLGNYKSRYKYMSEVLYYQKMHKSKFRSYGFTVIEAIFSINSYRAMNIIPSYQDNRFMSTMRFANYLIENGLPLIIFPEDSEKGYEDIMTKFHPGFYLIANYYNKTHDKEVPIYPIYYSYKKRVMIIGNKEYLSSLKELSIDEVCEHFKNKVNELNEMVSKK